MLSGKSTSFIENISKAAKLIGIAFQVRDDLLDYGISKGNIGKPEMQDILEDKITYPLYYALKSSSKKDSSKILKKLKNGKKLILLRETCIIGILHQLTYRNLRFLIINQMMTKSLSQLRMQDLYYF